MNIYVLTLNFKNYVVWIYEAFFVESSELANGSGIDLLERSPTSVLDISLLKSNYLHQLVSEGNLNGVRSVHFGTHSFSASVILYVFMDHCHSSKPLISSSLHMQGSACQVCIGEQ